MTCSGLQHQPCRTGETCWKHLPEAVPVSSAAPAWAEGRLQNQLERQLQNALSKYPSCMRREAAGTFLVASKLVQELLLLLLLRLLLLSLLLVLQGDRRRRSPSVNSCKTPGSAQRRGDHARPGGHGMTGSLFKVKDVLQIGGRQAATP